MNNETPGDTAAEREEGRNRPARGRRALLAMIGGTALLAGVVAYQRRLATDDVVAGVEVHARARDLPPLRFTDKNGAATSLAAFRGRVVLLNVWATWCLPCREEMPTLDRLQAALGGPNFEVVTVSIDAGGMPVVQAFFRQIGLKHLHPYLDTFHEAAALVGTGIPLTLLIDSDGREVGRKLGPATWDDPQILQLIRRHLPVAGPLREIKTHD